MADTQDPIDPAALVAQMSAAASALMQHWAAPISAAATSTATPTLEVGDLAQWGEAAQQIQGLWRDFQAERISAQAAAPLAPKLGALAKMFEGWLGANPFADPATQQRLWGDGLALFEGVLGQYGIGPRAAEAASGAATSAVAAAALPRSDRRFADPKWREGPLFALIHQSYLMLAEQALELADRAEVGDPIKRDQLRFATRTLVDMLSPANIALLNPVVLEKLRETKGQSLVKGVANLLADVKRGQLTHVDPQAFRLGDNIAATPGKVVFETPLYQLIHYTPTTEKVLEVPLVIFPPWINRFYILDLTPQKSFIRWALDHGVSVFVVSWKSADASMAEVVWDDYIAAQIEAIDHVCERLGVQAVHTIGYCVAGTTLAATLAILARRGQAAKVKSATFFTAQVDFADPGELKVFIDDPQLALVEKLSGDSGFLDGRYLAMTFNLLRGTDLIWNYVVNNYLLGTDYPAFDLLHWNGDVTNLPAKWHRSYLRDLYRDNKLVVPDALSAGGTPIDLTRIETPAFIQAGREDHIAPAPSVWRLMHHLRGPKTFVLAGSGHIAGVVNPPAAGKYQHWTNPAEVDSFAGFVAGATETPGSWWPLWRAWLAQQDDALVKAKGKRKPGGQGDPGIEDAPGRYVRSR